MCKGISLGIARRVLIVFNILFLIFGVLCLAIGIWVRLDKASVIALFRISDKIDTGSYEVPSLLESGAYILIAVGALVFIISVFGFCGALMESQCCLLTYGVLLIIVLIIQVATVIAVAVFKSKFDDVALDFLNRTMPDLYDGPYKRDEIASVALDVMQATQQCCGVNSQNDYMVWQKWNNTWGPDTAVIPVTCCKSNNMNSFPDDVPSYISGLKDPDCPVTKAESYKENCYNKLHELVSTYSTAVLGVGICVAILEVILIVVACCIAKRNDYEIKGKR